MHDFMQFVYYVAQIETADIYWTVTDGATCVIDNRIISE